MRTRAVSGSSAEDGPRDWASKAGGRADDPLGVALQGVPVHTGLVVEAVPVRLGRHCPEVAESYVVHGV